MTERKRTASVPASDTFMHYPIPSRLGPEDEGQSGRRRELLYRLTTNLLRKEIDLSDYQTLFAEHQSDLDAHSEALARILSDGRFPPMFILDLLDTYPDGTLLYRSMIGDGKLPTVAAALTSTVSKLQNEASRNRLNAKFDLVAEKKSQLYVSLEDAAWLLTQNEVTWPEFMQAFLESEEDEMLHKRAFGLLLASYFLSPNEQKQGLNRYDRLAELLVAYENGHHLLYGSYQHADKKIHRLELDEALRRMGDDEILERFHLDPESAQALEPHAGLRAASRATSPRTSAAASSAVKTRSAGSAGTRVRPPIGAGPARSGSAPLRSTRVRSPSTFT